MRASVKLIGAVERVFNASGRQLTLVVGAAASKAAPSSLPPTASLADLLEGAAAAHAPRTATWRPPRPEKLAEIPFELLMEQLDVATGGTPRFVPHLLAHMYSIGLPNSNHLAIAECARRGWLRAIFTFNFDKLIEHATGLPAITSEAEFASARDVVARGEGIVSVGVFHLHETVDHPDRLGALLSRVGAPDQSARASLLLDCLGQGPALTIGYSFSDQDFAGHLRADDPRVWRFAAG